MVDYVDYDTTYGQPVYKDGCGIFGVIRKKDAGKISNLTTVTGISCISYRGSDLGAGYALFDPSMSPGTSTITNDCSSSTRTTPSWGSSVVNG